MSKRNTFSILLGMFVVIFIGLAAGLLLYNDGEKINDTITITGTISDVVGSSLSAQTVELLSEGNSLSTKSDETGRFTFENVSAGKYNLRTTYNGSNNDSVDEVIDVSPATNNFDLYIPVLVSAFDFMPAVDEANVITRDDGTQAIAGEIVVRWQDNVSEKDRDSISEKYNLTVVADTPDILLSVFSTTESVDAVIEKLNTEPAIGLAAPSYLLQEDLVPYDPEYTNNKNNWWLKQVNAEPAWEINLGRSIIVGVVDGGFDFKHLDLGSAFTQARLNFTTEDINKSNDHGTHVSGIIAMQLNNDRGMVGIAPRARILPAKTHSLARVADAFRFYALCPTVKVVSISMGNNWWAVNKWRQQHNLPDLTAAEKKRISDDMDLILGPAVQLLTQKDKLIVHSAGNDAGDASVNTLNFDSIVTVAATDSNDNLAAFSNRGASVDIAAPGTDIYSTVTGNYKYMSGTSMATPLVAGIAALLRSARPALTAAQVKTVLEDTAEPSLGLSAESFGRVDAWRALLMATKQLGVEGTVYDDATFQVVPGADISDDLTSGVTADTEGFYRIPALPWREVTLRAWTDDKEDKQTVATPEYDVVVSLVDFFLKEDKNEDESNDTSNENQNENANVNGNAEDENTNDNENINDSWDSSGEHELLDNGVVISRAGCGVGGYPLPPAEGDCPDGFYFSRETIACEQTTCPAGAGRTYTLECKCPEGTKAIYACDITGYVVACVANTP